MLSCEYYFTLILKEKNVTYAINRKPVMRINLDAIEQNLHTLCDKSGATASQVIAVVKKSAYGLGSLKVGHFLSDLGVSHFAVASMEEAKVLRHGGISGDILILENLPVDYYRDARNLNLIHPIVDPTQLDPLISEVTNNPMRLHLCIDTGMSRNGLTPQQLKDPEILSKLQQLRDSIEGIYTHYHSSDEKDLTKTDLQRKLFSEMVTHLKSQNITGILHSSNSGGTLRYPLSNEDYIRTGIALYGCSPDSNEPDPSLTESVTIYSEVTSIRVIPQSQGVGYGHSWIASQPTRIATVSIGYANGLPRSLSNNGYCVNINGNMFPQVGRVTMDYCLVDIGLNSRVEVGDTVTFCDAFLDKTISVDSLAVHANTIGYEVLCRFGQGLRREYLRKGAIISSDERSIF